MYTCKEAPDLHSYSCFPVGYCGIARSDNHSITHNNIYYCLGRTVGCCLSAAQLPRLVVYITGPSPAVLTADREEGCCEVKWSLAAKDGVPRDTRPSVK